MVSPTLEVHLRHETRPARVLVFSKDVVTIGKKSSNDIVLEEEGISRLHARLRVQGGRLTVEDESTNGTYQTVDGRRVKVVSPQVLGARSVIDIGRFSLYITFGDVAASSAALPPPRSPPPPRPTSTRSPFAALDEEPISVEPLSVEPLSVEPLSVEPLSVEPLSGEPLSGEPLSVEPLPPSSPGVIKSAPRPTPDALTPTMEANPADDASPERTTPLPNDATASLTIARIYRQLALQFGNIGWGTPPQIDRARLPEIIAAAEVLLTEAGHDLSQWSDRIAHELCGEDPLSILLKDPQVVEVVVQGSMSLDVLRGSRHEPSPRTFSCPEAVHAAFARLTGLDLGAASSRSYADEELSIHAFSRDLAPHGPLLQVCRTDQSGGLIGLPEPVLYYLRRTLIAGAALLISGGLHDRISEVARLLADELSPAKMLVVVQRSGAWPPARWLVLDGLQEPQDLWICVGRIRRDWLIIEELAERDLPHLSERGPGGIIATHRLRPLESRPSPSVANRFDVHISARARESGPLIRSIEELRGEGVVTLFETREDGELSATGESPTL